MNENNKNSGIGLYRVYSGDIVIPKKTSHSWKVK